MDAMVGRYTPECAKINSPNFVCKLQETLGMEERYLEVIVSNSKVNFNKKPKSTIKQRKTAQKQLILVLWWCTGCQITLQNLLIINIPNFFS